MRDILELEAALDKILDKHIPIVESTNHKVSQEMEELKKQKHNLKIDLLKLTNQERIAAYNEGRSDELEIHL